MVLTTIGAYAVRADDPANPLLADSVETLHRVMALKWFANWVPKPGDESELLRQAILEERWQDAVLAWMDLTGEEVSVYPNGIEIHEARDYPADEFGPRIQTTQLFHD